MYNGIGLPTPRGSGTSGYIQKNLAHVSKKRQNRPPIVKQPDPEFEKPKNPELTLHQKKREIESRCLRLRKELEEEGWRGDKLELEIDAYRKRKLRELEESQTTGH